MISATVTSLVHLTKLNELGEEQRSCDLEVTSQILTITTFDLYDEDETTWPLSEVDFIAFVDAGTKGNIAALAIFGVLGLSARRNWTAITLSMNGKQRHFLARVPIYDVRRMFNDAATEAHRLRGKIIDGPPPAPGTLEPPEQRTESSLDALERLSSLYRQGFLTEEEFMAIKKRLVKDD